MSCFVSIGEVAMVENCATRKTSRVVEDLCVRALEIKAVRAWGGESKVLVGGEWFHVPSKPTEVLELIEQAEDRSDRKGDFQ